MLSSVSITHLFDNYSLRPDFLPLWGYSVLIDTSDQRILFDTGSNGRYLLRHLNLMNIDLKTITTLFITHRHWDHIGGIDTILEEHPDVHLVIPHTLSDHLISDLQKLAGSVTIIYEEPVELGGNIYTTGVMNSPTSRFEPEQAIILNRSHDIVLITGCAHPGIEHMVEWSVNHFRKNPILVMGGFHLLKSDKSEIDLIINKLKNLKIQYVAPSHCSGDSAIEQFKIAFQNHFIPDGAGRVISLTDNKVQCS